MNQHIAALRQLCADNHQGLSPYLVRTRFERHLYGLLVSFSERCLGVSPAGITERHIRESLATRDQRGRERDVSAAFLVARIFEKFTYLCDTSNWSDDGQDPRVEMCRGDILQLCDLIESITARVQGEGGSSTRSGL